MISYPPCTITNPPSTTKKLGEATPVRTDEALSVIYAGVKITNNIDLIDGMADDDLFLWSGTIPAQKGMVPPTGHYYQPTPHKVGEVKKAIEKHGLEAVRDNHRGLGASSIGALCSIFGEDDSSPIAEQWEAWEELRAHGLPIAMVVHTGDTSPEAQQLYGVTGDVAPGKSLHGHIAHDPILSPTEGERTKWSEAMSLLTVAVGGDTSVRDLGRLMRLPGRIGRRRGATASDPVRIQAVWHHDPAAKRYNLDTLSELLRTYVTRKFGADLNINEAIDALKLQSDLRLKVKKSGESWDLEDQDEVIALANAIRETRRATPEQQELALAILGRGAKVSGKGSSTKSSGKLTGTGGKITLDTVIKLSDGREFKLSEIAEQLAAGGKTALCFCPGHTNTKSPAATVGKTKGGMPYVSCFGGCKTMYPAQQNQGLVAVKLAPHDPATDALDAMLVGPTDDDTTKVKLPVDNVISIGPKAVKSSNKRTFKEVTTYTPANLVNGKYLPHEQLKCRVTYLPSVQCTGKTELMAWLSQNLPVTAPVKFGFVDEGRVGGVNHLRSLVGGMSRRLILPDYRNSTTKNIKGSVTWCLDSTHRIDDETPFNLLFIDEIHQLRGAFYGGRMDGYESLRVWDDLRNIIRSADRIVVADADLDQHDIDFMRDLLGWTDEEQMDEEIRMVSGLVWPYRYEITTKRTEFVAKFREFIKDGKKIYVAGMASEFLEKLKKQTIKAGCPADKVVVLTAESLLDHEKKGRTAENINTWITDYDVVLASPSLGTGVSIDVKGHFDHVMGLVFRNVGTANDAVQMVHRVRNPINSTIYLMIQGGGRERTTDPEKLAWELSTMDRKTREKAKVLNIPMGDDGTPTRGLHWEWYLRTVCERRKNGGDGCNIYHAFTQLLDQRGYEWCEWQDTVDPDDAKVIAREAKEARDEVRDERAADMMSAPEISIDEARQIREPESREQLLAIEKAEIKEFYGVEPTEELIKTDDRGKRRDKLRRLAYLRAIAMDRGDVLLKRDVEELQAKRGGGTHAKRRWTTTKGLLAIFNQIWPTFSFYIGSNQKVGQIDDARIKSLGQWATTHKRGLAILGMVVPKNVDEKPMQWVATLLGTIGMSLSSTRSMVAGLRTREYSIDATSYTEAMSDSQHYLDSLLASPPTVGTSSPEEAEYFRLLEIGLV